MKTPAPRMATTSFLLGSVLAIVAIVPRNSHCVELLHALSSPMSSSYSRHHYAFIHLRHSNDPIPINPCATDPRDPRYKCNGIELHPLSSTRSTSAQLAMPSSTMPPSSQRTAPSPWSPGTWKITLDFGNEASDVSEMLGEGWGSNSGRLGLSFKILANAETHTARGEDSSVERVWLGGKPTGSIEPQTVSDEGHCASYINEKGQQYVKMSSDQWRIEPPLPLLPSYPNVLPGQASTLRFSLTLLTPVKRNTIHFPQDQVLLLQSNTYRTQQYASGVQTLSPYQYAKDRAQEQLEEQLNHETGDRRLDGKDIFETAAGYKDVAELVKERDKYRRKWKEIEGVLPTLGSSINTSRRVQTNTLLEPENRWGIWPGDTELLTMERGVILAVVAKQSQRKKGFFSWMQDSGGLEQSVVVGKWSALPEFADDSG